MLDGRNRIKNNRHIIGVASKTSGVVTINNLVI